MQARPLCMPSSDKLVKFGDIMHVRWFLDPVIHLPYEWYM